MPEAHVTSDSLRLLGETPLSNVPEPSVCVDAWLEVFEVCRPCVDINIVIDIEQR